MSSCKVCGSATGSPDSVLCTACFNTGADLGSSGPLNGARASRVKASAKAVDAGLAQIGTSLREIAKRSRGRPRLGAEVMITRSIQVPPSQWAALEALAAATGTSTGAVVRNALAAWIERATSGPPPDLND